MKQYKNFKENQRSYKNDLGAGEIITKAGNPKSIKDHIWYYKNKIPIYGKIYHN